MPLKTDLWLIRYGCFQRIGVGGIVSQHQCLENWDIAGIGVVIGLYLSSEE